MPRRGSAAWSPVLAGRGAGSRPQSTGFVQAVVSRMVPVQTEEDRAEDLLAIRVEAYKRLPMDAKAVVGTLPPIVGVEPTNRFDAMSSASSTRITARTQCWDTSAISQATSTATRRSRTAGSPRCSGPRSPKRRKP